MTRLHDRPYACVDLTALVQALFALLVFGSAVVASLVWPFANCFGRGSETPPARNVALALFVLSLCGLSATQWGANLWWLLIAMPQCITLLAAAFPAGSAKRASRPTTW